MGKKDSGKHMVMDYHRLNKQTVKNNYLLPLITDLVDSMRNKKLFTKMDLRWDYNNVRIKKGDEWKAAFTTHVGSFEPVMIFFGMTNKVNFLGVVIGQGKIEMEENKVAGVLNWPIPRMVRDVRKFLELANYYRWFIKNFAALAKPLNILTRKDEKWKWKEAQ